MTKLNYVLHPLLVRGIRALAGEAAARQWIRKFALDVAAMVDAQWYVHRYPDTQGHDPLVHYMCHGAQEHRDPHALFDCRYYVKEHPQSANHPLLHYARYGVQQRFATHPQSGFALVPAPERPLRILTLFVRHGTTKYPGADVRLESLMERVLPECERRTVIVDNSLPCEIAPQQLDGRRTLIAGDNSSWEFSAWDRGLAFAGAELDTYDFVHFVTDAFEQFSAEFPARFDIRALALLRYGRAIAGNVDYYSEPASLFGRTVECWIRSSFFFLRPGDVRALGSMVSVHDRTGLFSGDATKPFRSESGLSTELQAKILSWLTGPGLNQGVEWHGRFDLNAHTLAYFEEKTTAILNELLLSLRLAAIGCRLVDITWLRGVLDGRTTGRPFQELWQDQLRNRD